MAAAACLVAAGPANASPVATDAASYSNLGAVFPDPQAGCPGGGPCDPNARGSVPAIQFIGVDEFRDALAFMNQNPAWQRYMEVWALDGNYDGDANGPDGGMFPGDSLPLEFDPKAEYVSAGLPTTGVGRRKSDLVVVRVTDESVPDKGKKRYALSLSIHGIERAGAEGGTRAMEDLVTAATTGRSDTPIVPDAVKKGGPTFAEVLKKNIIYFTYPNPDGWRRGSVSSGGVFFQRYNGNGVDPNRDWPDIGFSFRPYSAVSEPETQAWINFYNDVKRKTGDRFDAGDDLHGQPEADALSYTLLPHGRHRFVKNNRIQETAKRINRSTYEAIKWSPIVQDNDQPQGGGVPCGPDGPTGTACSQIYAQTWGTVFDTINYTTTGALGDWFDSSIGLNADGIDNEMSFSHLDKNIVFEPNTEQLHVAGNKALIFAHLTELTQPTADRTFDAQGRKGYVVNARVKSAGGKNFPDAPPGTHPDGPQDGDVPAAPDPDEGLVATFPITVRRSAEIYNGGMRVEATNGNIGGIGGGVATLKVQCRNCDRHPGVKNDSTGWVTVAEDFNQSPVYVQAGIVATVNDPQAVGPDGKATEWRAVVNDPNGAVHFHVVFTQGPASTSGDTGGGPPPEQRAYDVANTDFLSDLNGFMPAGQDFNAVNPRAVIAGKQSLAAYDTIVLADDALPGYTGPYGRKAPTGPKTGDVKLDGSVTTPGNGSGAEGTFKDIPFTIAPDAANKSLTATIEWTNPADDFDLYLLEKDGTEVAQAATAPPGNSETLTVESPNPGDYVVRVVNFASTNPSYTGKVTFEELKGGSTGDYTDDERAIWLGELKTWVRNGGNLVLTDGAVQALKDITPLKAAAVGTHKVYAGQSAFATDDTHPTTSDKLARDVEQQGARFGSGMRRQMFEPTPLGFAIQDASGGDAAESPEWDVDKTAWEKVGGRTVAASIDGDPSAAAADFTRVSIGELPIGDGQVRFAGALLPQPTEKFDHEFGLEPYSTTYTGYIVARNLFDAGHTRTAAESGGQGEKGKDTVRGKFVISRRLVKLRPKAIARVHVRCKAGRGCRGRLHLRVVKRLRVRKNGHRVRGKLKLVQIGQRKFRYKKAKRAVIRVKLTGEGRKLIGRHRRLRIRAAAPVRFGNGTGGVAKRRFWLERGAHAPHKR